MLTKDIGIGYASDLLHFHKIATPPTHLMNTDVESKCTVNQSTRYD